MVSEDPKLLNQILYVKVTKNNLSFDKQILPSTDDQVEKDLERLAQIVSKKSSLKRKNSDDLSDRSSCEKVEVSDSNENKEALEGLTYSKNDTDRSHVKKSAYFKIKLKKPTSKSKKIVTEHHDDKKHIAMATDFRKSLVINLERGAIPLGTIDPKSEKHIENGKDVSIEVIESEERSQTITDSLRMEVDTPDESKIGNPTEEQISPMITEDQENREKVLESKEKSSISDSEEGDRESTEENENSKNTVPNSPSNISEQESHEPANHNVEKVNLDGEESSEDPEVREEPSVENITTKMKSTCHNNEEKRYQASDDESPTSGAPENEEESCNRKSDQDQEDTDHKPKADSVPEKIMGDEELSSKKEGRDEKEIETGEKSGNEEAGEEETTNKDRSDVIKNDDEKDNDDKNENSDKEIEINDEDRKNIDLILTGLETDPSKSSQEDSEEKELSENNIKDTDEESEKSAGCKRKRADSPDLSNCPEKKKKKVTFSEDVLDAGE
ncbi:uncharacterized protein isoform X2 [Leptinotarsa decemlineata]|nr:myb-like protein X isoform X2 [Leptinotarsa decemlineata]